MSVGFTCMEFFYLLYALFVNGQWTKPFLFISQKWTKTFSFSLVCKVCNFMQWKCYRKISDLVAACSLYSIFSLLVFVVYGDIEVSASFRNLFSKHKIEITHKKNVPIRASELKWCLVTFCIFNKPKGINTQKKKRSPKRKESKSQNKSVGIKVDGGFFISILTWD